MSNEIKVIKPGVEILTPVEEMHRWTRKIEVPGRTCYKSEWNSGDPDKFVKSIVTRKHTSVIEHCVASVRFVVDRATAQQITRHRLAAYSMESQRYCNYEKRGRLIVIKPAGLEGECYDKWLKSVARDYETYQFLLNRGHNPEIARSVLPNCTKTELVSTYNLRVWRHLFKKRALNPRAQSQVRACMQLVLKTLKTQCPAIFGEFSYENTNFDASRDAVYYGCLPNGALKEVVHETVQ